MKPIFLSEVQKNIEQLAQEEKQEIRLLVWVNEKEEYRTLCFSFPCKAVMEKNRDLYRRYLLAMINNMLVSFGGAKLEIYRNREEALDELLEEVRAEFQENSERNNRTGYGVYLNYINRMNVFLGLGKFQTEIRELSEWPVLTPEKEYRIYMPQEEEAETALLKRTATELQNRCICSLDIGGNSIKGAVVKDGKVLVLKEHRWYPTGCRTADEMNSPMILMVRFLSVCTGLAERDGSLEKAAAALDEGMSYEELLAAAEELEAGGIVSEGRFDAIVAGFPDIVVHNKIAGGESFKQLGMKMNPDIDYEVEFFRTSGLDELMRLMQRKGLLSLS